MYQYIAKVNAARKKYQIWSHSQVERYVDNIFYSYSRGQFLVCLTNQVSGTIQRFISYHPFSNGQVICNIFYPTTDCITVNNGFNVYLLNGESKIYVPK